MLYIEIRIKELPRLVDERRDEYVCCIGVQGRCRWEEEKRAWKLLTEELRNEE